MTDQGWNTTELGAVAYLEMGQSPPSQFVSEHQAPGSWPFLQGNADFTASFPNARQWCTKPAKLAQVGDSLISVRAPVGALNLADHDYCIGRGLAAVRFNKVDARFGYHQLSLKKSDLRRVSQGSTFDAIGSKELAELQFLVPPVKEQRSIAQILDNLDALIRAHEQIIAKLRLAKIGTSFDLLDSGEWPLVPLGEVAQVRNGTTPSRGRKDYWEGGTIPWLASGKVNEYLVNRASEFVTTKAVAECNLRILPPGSVIIGMIGEGRTRGMSARVEIHAAINQNLAGIVPGGRLEGSFLHHYLVHSYQRLRSGGRGSNQDALNTRLVAEFAIPLPPVEEQHQIARTLGAIDCRVAQESFAMAKLSLLKDGLMNDLLTGRIRFAAKAAS